MENVSLKTIYVFCCCGSARYPRRRKKDFSSLHQTLIIRVTQLKIQLGERSDLDKLYLIYIYVYIIYMYVCMYVIYIYIYIYMCVCVCACDLSSKI